MLQYKTVGYSEAILFNLLNIVTNIDQRIAQSYPF
jgi:hypothetical protein